MFQTLSKIVHKRTVIMECLEVGLRMVGFEPRTSSNFKIIIIINEVPIYSQVHSTTCYLKERYLEIPPPPNVIPRNFAFIHWV